MPYVYRDSQKQRAIYQRRFPSEVYPLTGVWHQHKWPKTISLTTARELSAEKIVEFNALVEAARQRLQTADGMIEALRGSREQMRVMRENLLGVKDELPGLSDGIQRINDKADLHALGVRLGMIVEAPKAKGPVRYRHDDRHLDRGEESRW